MMKKNENKKTLLIGLDGATWKIINPLIKVGKLPNIKSLMENGTHGILMSDEKMVSPSVWTTILTGKNAQKHGILDFMTMQNKLKSKRIWDIFEDFNKKIGIAGFLMTWPPKIKGDGFIIPDHFAPDSKTIPEEVSFLRELTNTRYLKNGMTISKMMNYFVKSLQYHISVTDLLKAFSAFVSKKLKHGDYLDSFHKEINIFMVFLERIFSTLVSAYQPDFSAIYLAGTDVLAHKYWHFYKPEDFEDVDPALIKKYGNVIPNVYIASDRIIGSITKLFDKLYGNNYDIYIVSDHGFQTYHDRKYRPSVKIEYILNKLEMSDQFNYTKIGHMAIVTPIAENSETEFHNLNQLKDKLQQIVFEGNNSPVFETDLVENYMKISAQPYWKGYKFEDNIRINGEMLTVDQIFEKGVLITGTHEREGIIIMAGENIKKNNHLTGAEVYDVTPTILALNNMPVAKDMDGKVLTEAIDDAFWKDASLDYIESYGAPEDVSFSDDEMEKVKENEDELKLRLKSLGYME